jgi:recombination protein RecR
MDIDRFSSVLLENAVRELSSLPGIGRKTALRLALHLLKRTENDVNSFGQALIQLKKEVRYCTICHNISDQDLCPICSDHQRDNQLICVVEDIRDVMAIESTRQYRGLYHVLGGKISPMDGIGPGNLTINQLIDRVAMGSIKEIILALSTTVEGDTTNFFIFRKLAAYPVEISAIARGIGIGDELEYADEITLGRSITNRTPFQSTMLKS